MRLLLIAIDCPPRSARDFKEENQVKTLHLILFSALLTLIGGCTVINVYDKGVRVSRHIGLPIYSLKSNNGAVYFDITGVGLITSPSGASLGYVQQVYAQVPPGTCSVVIFTKSQTQSDELIEYFTKSRIDPNKICLTHNRN